MDARRGPTSPISNNLDIYYFRLENFQFRFFCKFSFNFSSIIILPITVGWKKL